MARKEYQRRRFSAKNQLRRSRDISLGEVQVANSEDAPFPSAGT